MEEAATSSSAAAAAASSAATAAAAVDTFDRETELAKAKFTQGLVEMLMPVVQELDSDVLAVRESQTLLFAEIERLSTELQKFLEHSQAPPLDAYVQKLVNARRRVNVVNNTLASVQERLDALYGKATRKRANVLFEAPQ